MAEGLSPDQELQAIAQERVKLRAGGEALEKRERLARETLARQTNESLMAAFSKGKFGSVSKPQAVELARVSFQRTGSMCASNVCGHDCHAA